MHYFQKSNLPSYFIGILLCLCLNSCQPQAAMTHGLFEQIPVGTSIASLEEQAGEPYEVLREKDGSETYRYLERIEIGPNIVDQITYMFKIVNGHVVYKQCVKGSGVLDIRSP